MTRLALALMLSAQVSSQPPSLASPAAKSPAQPAAFTANGAFFALSVADVDASATWYSEKLGLRVIMRPPKANQATVVVLEGGGLIVELIQRDDSRPLGKAVPGLATNLLVQGIFKVGVLVDDFDRTIATLRSRGVPLAFGPFPKGDQRANAAIRDNEGNLIQFFGK